MNITLIAKEKLSGHFIALFALFNAGFLYIVIFGFLFIGLNRIQNIMQLDSFLILDLLWFLFVKLFIKVFFLHLIAYVWD